MTTAIATLLMTNVTLPTPTVATDALPPLWAANAQACFAQAEVQFMLRNIILEEMRSWHVVVSALDSLIFISISPLLPTLSSRHFYTKFKDVFLMTYGMSDDK